MPRGTPANYLDATRGYCAEIVLTEDIQAAFAKVQELQDSGLTKVHPFDDPLVAAGQGTIGLEILEDAPDATHVFVSIGGGGLISGVATALRSLRPEVQVIGVETEGADAMAKALAAGAPVHLPAITSIARTLGAPCVSAFTLEHTRRLAREVIVVPDSEAVDALVFLLERAKVAVALPGATLPGGLTLERRKLRGQMSEGMILAEDELAIGIEHAGIMVLDDGLVGGEGARVVGGLCIGARAHAGRHPEDVVVVEEREVVDGDEAHVVPAAVGGQRQVHAGVGRLLIADVGDDEADAHGGHPGGGGGLESRSGEVTVI